MMEDELRRADERVKNAESRVRFDEDDDVDDVGDGDGVDDGDGDESDGDDELTREIEEYWEQGLSQFHQHFFTSFPRDHMNWRFLLGDDLEFPTYLWYFILMMIFF